MEEEAASWKWEAGLCSQTAQQAANERAPLARNEERMRGGGTAIGRARGVTGAPEQCGSAKKPRSHRDVRVSSLYFRLNLVKVLFFSLLSSVFCLWDSTPPSGPARRNNHSVFFIYFIFVFAPCMGVDNAFLNVVKPAHSVFKQPMWLCHICRNMHVRQGQRNKAVGFFVVVAVFVNCFCFGVGVMDSGSQGPVQKCYNTKMFQNPKLKNTSFKCNRKIHIHCFCKCSISFYLFFLHFFFLLVSMRGFAVFGHWQKNKTKQKTVHLQIQVALQRNVLLLVNRMHGQRKLFYFTMQNHKFTHHQWTHLFFSALTDAFDSSS